MRLRPRSILSTFIASGLCFGQAPIPTQGVVAGRAYCDDTRTPCRFAGVTIQSAPPAKDSKAKVAAAGSQSYSASTDIEGAFQIRDVPAGDYYILGTLPGYLSPIDLATSECGQDQALCSQAIDAALTRITVRAGQTIKPDLTLLRGGAIGGQVQFDDGGLGINLPTQLYRRDAAGHWKQYKNSAGDSDFAPLGIHPHTDDRGRFYEPGLPPGVYTMGITLPQSSIVPSTILGRPSLNMTITTGDALQVFTGNKYRLREAAPIEIHQGEDRSDLDMVMPTNGLHSIRGFVTARSDGSALRHGNARLLDPEDKTLLRETAIQEDGSYAFNYVADGSYLINIESGGGEHALAYEPLTAPLLIENDMTALNFSLIAAKQ